jgi:hypothetical protein
MCLDLNREIEEAVCCLLDRYVHIQALVMVPRYKGYDRRGSSLFRDLCFKREKKIEEEVLCSAIFALRERRRTL